MSTLKYWVWLATRKGVQSRTLLRVLEWFGTPEQAYFADPSEYEHIAELTAEERSALTDRDLIEANVILGECERLGIRILTCQDVSYPERLRNIYDPPLVLYVKGKSIPFDEKVAIGMVGTRTCTPYGIKMGGRLALELARSGAVVVSGIAEGIDAACIRAALKGGGTVVSVLGGGIDVPYPRCNQGLYEDVAAVGALISEYPPGTRPLGAHFPIRNRIISGLSVGVVVVESGLNGGSMRTVEHVADQSRDLFAVPGPADSPASEGANQLIREGSAKLVTEAWHILEEYVDRYPTALRRREALPEEVEESRLTHPEQEGESAHPARGRRLRAQQRADDPIRTVPPMQTDAPTKSADDEGIAWSKLRDRLTDDQRDILLALAQRAQVVDELVEQTQIPARRVLSALTILEVQGYVTQEAGKRFCAQVKLKME